jgi:hypothetical protein
MKTKTKNNPMNKKENKLIDLMPIVNYEDSKKYRMKTTDIINCIEGSPNKRIKIS